MLLILMTYSHRVSLHSLQALELKRISGIEYRLVNILRVVNLNPKKGSKEERREGIKTGGREIIRPTPILWLLACVG